MDNLIPYNFFFELPLYTKLELNQENQRDFVGLMSYRGIIDAYNPILKENTSYQVSSNVRIIAGPSGQVSPSEYKDFTTFQLTCLRQTQYKITCFVHLEEVRNEDWTYKYIVRKVGQYPSIADLHISKIKEYDKVLSKPKLKEFTRAIGLAASGVGIGSFVYLRRIFEDLIEDAHQAANQAGGFDEAKYNFSKIADRIGLLKEYLPDFLVSNKSMYGILSKGVHELDEQECLAYFETLKVGIELILDEKAEKLEKQKKLEEAQKKIQAITQQLGSK